MNSIANFWEGEAPAEPAPSSTQYLRQAQRELLPPENYVKRGLVAYETDIVVEPQLIYNLVWTFMLQVLSGISTGKSG